MAQPGRKKREDSPYAEQSQRLSTWLRSLRESAGLSQDQLARRAGVTIATLRKLEAGKIVNPGHFIVMALLGALDARPEDLSAYVDPAAAADELLPCAIPRTAKRGWHGMHRGITCPLKPVISGVLGDRRGTFPQLRRPGQRSRLF